MDTISKESIPTLSEVNAELRYREFKADHYAAALKQGQEYHVMGLTHHGITLTTEEHAAALLAGTITLLPVLLPFAPAPLDTFTAVESQRHKDRVTFVDAHNKQVATLQKALMTLRRDLLQGLNQESRGALQSIHGHVALVTLSTNIIWTYLDSQYL